MDVFIGLPFFGKHSTDVGEIKLYFKSTVRVKELVYDYETVSMVADIGGYTGLLLGVSAANISAVIKSMIMEILSKYFPWYAT